MSRAHAAAHEYGPIYERITTLAWVGPRHARLRLGSSVIVVPRRDAVVRAFAAIGVEHLAVAFEPRDPGAFVPAAQQFGRDVVRAAVASRSTCPASVRCARSDSRNTV